MTLMTFTCCDCGQVKKVEGTNTFKVIDLPYDRKFGLFRCWDCSLKQIGERKK